MKSSRFSPLSAFSICQRSLSVFAVCFFVLLPGTFFFLSALGGLLLSNQLCVLHFFFQVQKRFMDLLNLFKASSGDRTRESTNEDSCSEDEAEDEEDSETIGESDGEQVHDA